MKKEELTSIGLTDEQAEKVFAMNGKDVNAAKDAVKASMQTNIDSLTEQLNTATESLKKFDGVDPTKLTKQISDLNEKLAIQKASYEKKIADRDFNDLLSKSITKAGGKNAKAIAALLDVETLRGSKNQEKDIDSAIENVKKENDYLFTSNQPIGKPVLGTGGSPTGGAGANEEYMARVRAAMGLKDPKKKD